MSNRLRYVIAYDIRDDKRLRRVAATMTAYGWRMQYSVFICDLDTLELMALRTDLAGLIKHDTDSIAMIEIGAPDTRGRTSFSFMGMAPSLPTSGPLVI